MRCAAFALLLAVAASAGCVTYERGRLAAVSTLDVGLSMTVVKTEAEGRSCSQVSAQRYPDALDAALRDAPGANALVDATYSFEELCIVVRGTAVHVP